MDNSIEIISQNIIELRDALGLSQNDFALLANISSSTLINIESGKKSFRLNTLNGILELTGMKLGDLSNPYFNPPKNFREKLIKKYRTVPSIFVILNQDPSIPYCIKHKLLNTDFLNGPREIREIRDYLASKFGWNFRGNSIHAALRRLPNLIKIEQHPTKKGTNLYSRKR